MTDIVEGIDFLRERMSKDVDPSIMAEMERLQLETMAANETHQALRERTEAFERLQSYKYANGGGKPKNKKKNRGGNRHKNDHKNEEKEHHNEQRKEEVHEDKIRPTKELPSSKKSFTPAMSETVRNQTRKQETSDHEEALRGLDVLREQIRDPQVLEMMEGLRQELLLKNCDWDGCKAVVEADGPEGKELVPVDDGAESDEEDSDEEFERHMAAQEHLEMFRKVFDRVNENFLVQTAKSTYDISKDNLPLVGRFMKMFEDQAMKAAEKAPQIYENYCYSTVDQLFDIYRKGPMNWSYEMAQMLSPGSVLSWAMRRNSSTLNDKLGKLKENGNEVFNEDVKERLESAAEYLKSIDKKMANGGPKDRNDSRRKNDGENQKGCPPNGLSQQRV